MDSKGALPASVGNRPIAHPHPNRKTNPNRGRRPNRPKGSSARRFGNVKVTIDEARALNVANSAENLPPVTRDGRLNLVFYSDGSMGFPTVNKTARYTGGYAIVFKHPASRKRVERRFRIVSVWSTAQTELMGILEGMGVSLDLFKQYSNTNGATASGNAASSVDPSGVNSSHNNSVVKFFCDSTAALHRIRRAIDAKYTHGVEQVDIRSDFDHHTRPITAKMAEVAAELEAMGVRLEITWMKRKTTNSHLWADYLAGEWAQRNVNHGRCAATTSMDALVNQAYEEQLEALLAADRASLRTMKRKRPAGDDQGPSRGNGKRRKMTLPTQPDQVIDEEDGGEDDDDDGKLSEEDEDHPDARELATVGVVSMINEALVLQKIEERTEGQQRRLVFFLERVGHLM